MKDLNKLTNDEKVSMIKNWTEELAQNSADLNYLKSEVLRLNSLSESQKRLYEESKKYSAEILAENIKLKEELKNSKPSISKEELNKLVNDRIVAIFNNPLTYMMELPVKERNEFIGRIYKLILG